MDAALWAMVGAVFVACLVEMVEATTIVLAMGVTRGWRSVWIGVAAAVVALVLFTATVGYALANWLPEAALHLAVGTLLLIFGLQWLRKAIYRSAGRKAMHDEDEIFAEQVSAGEGAGRAQGFDQFGFVLTFKAIFLEGVEVVFIVLTFGLSAGNVPLAAGTAVVASVLVLSVAVGLRRPLAMVPENTMKYGVGLLLTTFGIFWAVEGVGVFRESRESLHFPGGDLALLVLLAVIFALTRLLIAAFRSPAPSALEPGNTAEVRAP